MTDSFQVLAHDVSGLPKAPDLEYHVSVDRKVMQATLDGWDITIGYLGDGRSSVSITLDGEPYCRCEHIQTESPHFQEENLAAEVASFASGLFWSAWRRFQIGKGET